LRQHQRGSGVAGDDRQIGTIAVAEAPEQPNEMLGQRILGHSAVREASVVRHVDELRVRSSRRDLPIHGQSAKAGIDYQDAWSRHRPIIVTGG